MKLKVCIAGATGWVGRPLCLAVRQVRDHAGLIRGLDKII
jgi:nucleoside-diphosphate-sugar epimerase